MGHFKDRFTAEQLQDKSFAYSVNCIEALSSEERYTLELFCDWRKIDMMRNPPYAHILGQAYLDGIKMSCFDENLYPARLTDAQNKLAGLIRNRKSKDDLRN